MDTTKNAKTNDRIFTEFQMLRNEQRNLINTLTTHEINLKEHK